MMRSPLGFPGRSSSGLSGTGARYTSLGRSAGSTWFGGSPGAYVVYPELRSGEEVAMMRIIPRNTED